MLMSNWLLRPLIWFFKNSFQHRTNDAKVTAHLTSCSWHQTTKPLILFFLILFMPFSQFGKENKLFIGCPKQFFFPICASEKFVFFFNCSNWETENLWKWLGKTRLVVWCFDVMNKIIHCKCLYSNYSHGIVKTNQNYKQLLIELNTYNYGNRGCGIFKGGIQN